MSNSFGLCSVDFIIEPYDVLLLGNIFNNGGKLDMHGSSWCSKVGGFFCGCLVREDCRKGEDLLQLQQQSGEDPLFCTLCNAEVQEFTQVFLFFVFFCFFSLGYSGNVNLDRRASHKGD